jgi:hypothetical protein
VCSAEESGFVSVRIYAEVMVVQFINTSGRVLKEVTVHKNREKKRV